MLQMYKFVVEILSLLSQKEDVLTILPDWTQIPLIAAEENTEKVSNKKPRRESQGSSINGIEILLQGIGKYRKKQPESEQEVEMLENNHTLHLNIFKPKWTTFMPMILWTWCSTSFFS